MPQLPAVHVVLTTLQLGQLVEVLPAAQAVVAELLEELAVLLATLLVAAELEALELEIELAAVLLADEALLELATELLAAAEDLLLLELATELEALLLAVDEAALDEVLAVREMEHSFFPPDTREPNVASAQAKLPLSVA